MFLSEHVLYGSSRLGTSTYNKYHMGYTSGSLAYPTAPGFNVCYTESHENEMESGREPMGGNTTGPIGGGNHEILLANGPHRVAGTRTPITGVNLPWAGDDENVKPTKEGTFFVPGRKRYEFSNHLGNVLVTVSDMPLGVDADSNGTAEYYMPDVKTTSDYEPFGAPLPDRTLSENNNKYRFGFNGQIKDDEVYGEGSSYTAEFWQYDPRTARRWNIDPKPIPSISPYATFEDNPILYADPFGDKIINGHKEERDKAQDKMNQKKNALDAFNGNTEAKGYKKALREFNQSQNQFNRIDAVYQEVQTAITDLEKYNNPLFLELDHLTYTKEGPVVDVYVHSIDNLYSDQFDETMDGFNTRKSVLGLTSGEADQSTLITTAKTNESYFSLYTKWYGKNSVIISLNSSTIDKSPVLSHEGGHALYLVKNVLAYVQWLKANPGKSEGGHGGGNPSGLEADKQEAIFRKNRGR